LPSGSEVPSEHQRFGNCGYLQKLESISNVPLFPDFDQMLAKNMTQSTTEWRYCGIVQHRRFDFSATNKLAKPLIPGHCFGRLLRFELPFIMIGAIRRPEIKAVVFLFTDRRSKMTIGLVYKKPIVFVRATTLLVLGFLFFALLTLASFGETEASRQPPEALRSLIPNPDFRAGEDLPAGWKFSSEPARWLDRDILEIEGRGQGSSYWFTNVTLKPGALYLFRMVARSLGASGGCVVTGPAPVNHDYQLSEAWKEYSHVFRMTDGVTQEIPLRLGQWELSGRVQFDKLELVPALPIHTRMGNCVMGDGETIQNGIYSFEGTFDGTGTNYHRVLQRATVGFNTNRWTFSEGQEVVYKFELPETSFLSGQLGFVVNYATGGTILAEVSRDDQSWIEAARQDGVGAQNVELSSKLFPTPVIYVRLRKIGQPSSMQVDRIEFHGKINRPLPDFRGATVYAIWNPALNDAPDCPVTADLEGHTGSAPRGLRFYAGRSRSISLRGEVIDGNKQSQPLTIKPEANTPQEQPAWVASMPQVGPGQHRCLITVSDGNQTVGTLEIPWEVNEYYRADYGELLTEQPDAAIWWCEADWKIPRDRPPPAASADKATMVRLSAARGDYESVQVVVSPRADGLLKSVHITPLKHSTGATISDNDLKVQYVYYHYVHTPTDKVGVRDWWPDALPPLEAPIALSSGKNQPLWLTIHVPSDKPAGDYLGEITLTTEQWAATVPIQLHVWDFTLPERNHIETAFGFDPYLAFRYHNAKTEEERRKLLDLYFELFSEHRISPYNPTPLDPFVVRFDPQANPPTAMIDFSRFDQAMEKAVSVFNFTNFDVSIQGMGGGTFHDRTEPAIAGFGESTPQYQAMFASQVQQIENHLREKGWLDMAYVYWFDEPEPKDYEFVRAGMERLKKYAPGLRRMLTEEPVEPLYGAVDIWCPVTPNYNHEAAESRRKHGERFWWYVCTGPKAPYCTLFIDHPATELRVWLWQTWQRKIDGILVWSANYWTSSAAFPDGFQDPYEDPMGYVSGYSTPKGVKRHWGNGDGRFIYPPLSASVPGKTPQPVVAKPVSSIRWEMLREGIEDFEMLWLLRDLLEKKETRLSPDRRKEFAELLTVPPNITSDMTTFTKSPKPIYEHRRKVAQAIEELMRLE